MKKTTSLPATHKIGEYTAYCGQRHIFPYTIECGINQPPKRNLSISKKKSIDLKNEVYRSQKWNLSTSKQEINRLRIRILSIQTVNLSVGSVGPIADYSHSIVDGGFDEMS